MKKVIFVDDDRTNTILIKRLLELDGFEVLVCPDVDRAIQAAILGVDAFVIDCNLAQGDNGIDLLHAIRLGQTAIDSNIPIIVTSGDDSRGLEAAQAGASIFLIKPYSPNDLSKHLYEIIN